MLVRVLTMRIDPTRLDDWMRYTAILTSPASG